MNFFIPKSNIPVGAYIRASMIVPCFLAVLHGYRFREHIIFAFVAFVAIIWFADWSIKCLGKWGLYIDDEKLYYKGFRRKELSANDIRAIKISKAREAGNLHYGFYDLKDEDGKQLYSMMFLKEISNGMDWHDRGDMSFYSQYKEQILFYTIYDQSVIDYLLTLNPNIIVF